MNDQQTTIQELRDLFAHFVIERDWNQFHDPKNLSMGLAIEAAELMETFHLLSVACHENHEEEIYILLNSLVPESQVCQQLLLQE